MAKQSGIHQLKGKVGEMSYYRTKGVDAGIVRRINQGLSERVKTEAAFANTRLNNAEFKEGNALATAAFNSVSDRKRGMMRNFAIAAMTKRALEAIKTGTGSWGQRKPDVELDSLICDMLEHHAKGGAYDGMYGIPQASGIDENGEYELTIEASAEVVNSLIALGIDGFYVIVSNALAGQKTIDGEVRLFSGSAVGTVSPQTLVADTALTIDITSDVSPYNKVGMSPSGFTFAEEDAKHGFWACVTFLPYRQSGAVRHTLQEYCTYVALPLGQREA